MALQQDLRDRYINLAGSNYASNKREGENQMATAQAQYKAELDRQRAEREKAERDQRKNWWKQLIPGALGLVGTGIGAAAGGLPGAFIGSQAGGMLGSGIAASQGVPGAAQGFNQMATMSPMMMAAFMQNQPSWGGGGGGAAAPQAPQQSSLLDFQDGFSGTAYDGYQYGDVGMDYYRHLMDK